MEIRRAETAEDLERVRSLLREYVEFIASHWPQVDREAFAEELRDLDKMYTLILLALTEGEPAACVMLREGDAADVCEARRLYVRPVYRRQGLARALMTRLMAEAAEGGCREMRLVTVVRFMGAIPLYESLGFRRVEPYRPSTMPPDVVTFMQRELGTESQ